MGGLYLKSLHAVTLGSIPLDDKLSEVQEENIPTVETLPRHFHLESHRGGADSIHTPAISSPHPPSFSPFLTL